ncbi:MAG: methyl-accepting chemotaxis protein, partial [bacterium]|nr:methyl-accepting chemotaxis protein [bacterium]
MVVSNGFGLLKISNIGNHIKGIAEEDIPLPAMVAEITVNQLEQAIWFERALRFGEVLASKEAAREGLKHAEEEFEILTKMVDEELKQGEEMAEHAAKVAKTAESQAEFEEIDERLKVIDEHHANYEHHVHQAFALINKGALHEAEALAESVEKEEDNLNHELEQLLKEI